MRTSALRLTLTAALLGCTPAPEAEAPAAPSEIASTPTPAEEPGVTFTRGSPAVGTKCTKHSAQQLSLHVEQKGKVLDIQDDRNRKIGVEILAVADGAVIEQKVTYQVAHRRKVLNGEEQSAAEAVQGKSYIVARRDGATVITDSASEAVPEPERELVADNHPLFGERDPFQSGMPEEELRPGDRVPALEAALRRDFETRAEGEPGGEGVGVDSIEVMYDRRRGDVGVFSVRLVWKHNDPQFVAMTIPFKGILEVRIADAQPVLLEMEAPVGVAPPDGTPAREAAVRGHGKMSMKLRYTCP